VAQNQKDLILNQKTKEIKDLKSTIKTNWMIQSSIQSEHEKLKEKLLAQKTNRSDPFKDDTLKNVKKPKKSGGIEAKLVRALDCLVKDDLKQISKTLDLPISGTKETLIENISSTIKASKKSKEFLKGIEQLSNKECPKTKDLESYDCSDEDDYSDCEVSDDLKKPAKSAPIEKKSSLIRKMDILKKDYLVEICDSLDLAVSGTKDKLIQNICSKLTCFKSILSHVSKDGLKDICQTLSLTVGGNKDELIEKITSKL
jgi:hypothetical protein